ncbi:hypothetical protein HOL24_01840 [bacterium]|jgi:acyl carrier protein|nr:hypothetical protein [bacterium]
MGNGISINEVILDFFVEHGVDVVIESAQEFDFMDGLIDSFEVMSLLIQIEQTLDTRIEPTELLEEQNRTILGLINLVKSKQ